MSILKKLYVVLGVGVLLSFFGHGMFAVTGKESFGELVTGSFGALGASMSPELDSGLATLASLPRPE